MSSLNPDQATAERLAGRRAESLGRDLDPVVGDGSLVDDPAVRPPLVLNNRSFSEITEIICGYAEKPPGLWWWAAFLLSSTAAGVGTLAIVYLLITGVGTWGLNNQIGWAWDITNFVFWIGIGHAGTLISAILALFKQKWRTAVNRSAEAMTIFAVMCAGMFPAIHVGRIWFIWMVFPIPNYNYIWPNFRSPLLWDVFAVSTYFTVSLLFWYMGLIPDLATLRDRAQIRLLSGTRRMPDLIRAYTYGFLALGWRFSTRHWHRYEKAYILLAGLSTPLVLSVHSIVSFDFATSILPGWHTTIFPPYFVAGAIFGGFAMVLLLMIPARELYPNFKDFLTLRHLENMAKIVLVTGWMVGFAYAMEFFIAWYGGNEYELFAFTNRATGPYWWAYWTMITCNVVSPNLFWIRRFRQSPLAIWIVSLLVTIGMWFERFVIIVTSLHRTFLPGQWHMFFPTPVDILIFVGSCGVFVSMFLLFMRFLPMFAMAEVKAVIPQADPHAHDRPDTAGDDKEGN
jgi:Ni/Fe-hydrogenase subunit HybB-like protein